MARPKLTAELKQRIIQLLTRSGVIEHVLAFTSVSRADYEAARRTDPDFADFCDDAITVRCHAIEEEITRRAIDGWEEPVFGMCKNPDGSSTREKIGTVRKFSDTLLLALAKRHIPAYRERVAVDHGGQLGVKHEVSLESLRQLSPAAQDKLREIVIEAEEAARARLPSPPSMP